MNTSTMYDLGVYMELGVEPIFYFSLFGVVFFSTKILCKSTQWHFSDAHVVYHMFVSSHIVGLNRSIPFSLYMDSQLFIIYLWHKTSLSSEHSNVHND